ncbi:MAG: YggS family pyridoxal phosphate-dependent enzyme, partial [Candidatus Margulisiibacteriota bacterium]
CRSCGAFKCGSFAAFGIEGVGIINNADGKQERKQPSFFSHIPYYAIITNTVSIKENLQILQERIACAARIAGRSPQDIKLVAVTKTVPVDLIEQAIQAGVTDIGESRVQEAAAKAEILKKKYLNLTWHMIGHLQRNKTWQALDIFDIIQSIDSERLAQKVEEKGKIVPVLLEVKTSDEVTKYGVPVERAIELLKVLSGFRFLRVQGLMTVAPLTGEARAYFVRLRKLSEEISNLRLPNIEMKYLSMGMSDDFETAIQEGSNLIRIGRAIFGTRGGDK